MHGALQAGLSEASAEGLQRTAEYLGHEAGELARAQELWQRIARYEGQHPVSLKVRARTHACMHAGLPDLPHALHPVSAVQRPDGWLPNP